jgi:glucuronoarabinoxylan endo-1,4-beta-xylanase
MPVKKVRRGTNVTNIKNFENIIGPRIFLLLLIISLITASIEAGENLLINPGFEEGTSGWNGRGCTFSTSTVSRSGSYSGYATNRSFFWEGIKQSVLGKMIPGETYTISAWMKLENSSSDQIIVTIEQKDDRGTSYTRVNETTGYDSRWTLLSGRFTLEAVGILTTLDVYFEGPAEGVNFYLDDVEVLGRVPEPLEPPKPNATGSVDVSTVYQELEGFGASGTWYENWLLAHPLKNEIYDVLFGQLGLDILSLQNTYDIRDIYSNEILAAAESSLGHPLKILLISGAPPAYLIGNEGTAPGTLARYPGGGYKYREFAQWWADSLEVYSNHGINADYVSVQNEPDWQVNWDSCKFTPTETAEWAGYNLAFEAVYQELASRMTDMPKLLAPDSFGCSASRAYIDELIDPSHVYGYAHHLYADGDYDNPDSFIPAMQSFAAKYGDKPLFQTEYARLAVEEAFSVALNLARHIHNSLVHEGVCSFCYFNLFWGDEGGLVTLDFPWQPNPGYTINHTYYAFKQYSAFTDPGWHRIEASTDSSGLRISAFKNEDGSKLTVVIINVSDIYIDLTLSLGSFSPDSSKVYRTSETEHTAYIGTFDQTLPLMLSAETITTVSLTGSYVPPLIETFEQGDFSGFNWRLSGEANWFVTSGQSHTGTYSARAGAVEDGESSTLTVEMDCASGSISFYRKVSSESGFDCLTFYIDGTEQDSWSGSIDWGEVTFPVTAGRRTFKWVYAKDGSVSDGDDTAWIDDITFPR